MPDFQLGAAMRDYKENSQITVLDPGSYVLEVVGAKATKSKNGNPTIIPSFKVAAGPYAGKRVLAGNITYTENAAPYFFRALQGFGIDETFLEQANSLDDPIKAIADALVGRVAEINLTIENWQGEDRNKLGSVRLARATGAPAPAPVPAAPVAQAAPPQQTYQQPPPQYGDPQAGPPQAAREASF